MKKLLFILLLTIPFSGFGQSEEKIEYWDNGQLESEEKYKNGELDGPSFYYYENGQSQSEENFKNGNFDYVKDKHTGYESR